MLQMCATSEQHQQENLGQYLLSKHANLTLQAWHKTRGGFQAAALALRSIQTLSQRLSLALKGLHL